LQDLEKFKTYSYQSQNLVESLYRPFFKCHLYFDKDLNAMLYQNKKLFPATELKNLVICVSGIGGSKDFSTLITNHIPILHVVENGQSFPLYYYEERQKQSKTLFDENGDSEYIRRDGVSDFILDTAKKLYGNNVTKEDIFYYVYGFLHSPEYRIMFANDLKKMLPRLPLVEDVKHFWAFSKAGRKLAELHINYESVPPYKEVTVSGSETKFFIVEKMRFPKKDQKETIIYNSKIRLEDIPAKAYEYVVNGKSAIEWIMERYQVTVHKESGIKNDPNDWAAEVGNPRYILDLLLSIVNVSVQTVDIVAELPKVKFE
jgi:predicted helicase